MIPKLQKILVNINLFFIALLSTLILNLAIKHMIQQRYNADSVTIGVLIVIFASLSIFFPIVHYILYYDKRNEAKEAKEEAEIERIIDNTPKYLSPNIIDDTLEIDEQLAYFYNLIKELSVREGKYHKGYLVKVSNKKLFDLLNNLYSMEEIKENTKALIELKEHFNIQKVLDGRNSIIFLDVKENERNRDR